MCGLFGAVSSFLTKGEVEEVMTLAYLSRFRGLDSTGISVVQKNKKNKGNLCLTHKMVMPAGIFVDCGPTYDFLKDKVDNPFVVIGHTRAATTGDVNETNAQPFHFKHICGSHNGQLSAYDDPDKKLSDSYRFYQELSKAPLKETMEYAYNKGRAAFALVWWDNHKKKLFFLRNDQRTLFYSWCGNTMYWASERRFLQFVDSGSTSIFTQPVSFEPDTLYSLSPGDKEMKKEKVDFKPKWNYNPIGATMGNPITRSYGEQEWERWLDGKDNNREVVRYKNDKKSKESNIIHIGLPTPKSSANYNYIGFGNKVFTKPVIESLFNHIDGCYCCGEKQTPAIDVHWRTDEDYLCHRCYNTPFMKEMEVGLSGDLKDYEDLFYTGRIIAA